MLKRNHRQIYTCHQPALLGPKAASIHNMFGVDSTLFRDHIPRSITTLAQV